MVKVLANGEIVPDDDPRTQSSNQSTTADSRPRQGSINRANNGPAQHGQPVSVFDSINQRLSAAGVPTWHVGPYSVRPVVSLGFLLSLLVGGFRGLLFSGFLFLVVNYSQYGWPRGGTAAAAASGAPTATSTGSTSGGGGGGWPRGGQRLGRS